MKSVATTVRRVALAALSATLLLPAVADAHGIWGHIHVTGWAIQNLPDGELSEFFAEPEVMNAALFGAAFTDSGYFPQTGDLSVRSRAYSEHTHWEPFIEDFVEWIVENDPPPWDTIESRQRAAFLMGAASHGLQDEVFDSLFLYQVREHDGGSQTEADPGSDGFLALDGHIRFFPEPYYPVDTLVELYGPLGEDVDAATIQRSVDIMTLVYVSRNGVRGAESLGNRYSEDIPWTRAHYLDPEIPGSLRAEIVPTMTYLEALWARLHGTFEPEGIVTSAYPEQPRRLRSHEAGLTDNVVTLMFGMGVERSALESAYLDDAERDVPHRLDGTRWGHDFPRLVRFKALEDLVPGGFYSVALTGGVNLIDGSVLDEDVTFRFQVACTDDTAACDPVEGAVGEIDGPEFPPVPEDVGVGADAGTDAGTDATVDTSEVDAGSSDVAEDVAAADVGVEDVQSDDVADAQGEDTAVADTGANEAPTGIVAGSSCSASNGSSMWGPLGLLGLLMWRRRR